MRDGGSWRKSRTTGEGGWQVVKEARRERAMSEYQRGHNAKLSTPKRQAEKYEEQLQRTRDRFYPKSQE